MAQLSESLHPRPPQPLDTGLVKPHPQLGQEQQQQEQQHQLLLQRDKPPRPPPPDDSRQGTTNYTHSVHTGAGHGSGSADKESTADGGASPASARPNNHNRASTSSSTDSTGDLQNGHGQNGTRCNGDTPLPTTPPPMSNSQPPPHGHSRQPVSYPSPTAFPPAGMPSAAQYAYAAHAAAQQAGPPADPYRPSPTALPSMRTIDHQQQQQQHQHGMPIAAHMAGQMHPGATPMGFYTIPPHPYTMHHPDPNAMRYALPPTLPPDPRIAMSGGRHKKEIKRRTKTGCLTCRKRRIKCDEAHPTCNNCKKSKRECLGYDPIFKQQQGPAAIQPAPNSQPPAPATLASTPTLPSSTTRPYQPTVVPSSYPPPLPSNATFNSQVPTTPQGLRPEGGFDYSTAIDPALQGADTTTAAGTPASQHQQHRPEGLEQRSGIQSQIRGETPFPAKKMKVDELIALGGAAPPTPSSPPSPGVLDEIIRLYFEVYVPGLSLFFETRWYSFKKGQSGTADSVPLITNNQPLVTLFASFLSNIIDIRSTDPADMVYAGHLETCVVWALASLPKSFVPQDISRRPSDPLPCEDDHLEARNRLHVFEMLLSGETLPSNPLAPVPVINSSPTRKHELEFWYQLAQYLLKSHSSASSADTSARGSCLDRMRSLLDGRENRDVLYSIAVLREYTPQWDAALNEKTVPSHLEESDSRSKLAVATRFIRDESASTGGTTNVVRRFADLAYRAFVRPGVNIDASRRTR
ncbi:transcriptional regulatory protein moc3 [Diplogelasinospora grovesii]|uniref:Transcriptional regulatory protein moc3 n=1 Tax=Diplogelasinospora grovesii TaxID=303347 RepID=A0AAN6NCG6_9PEZI|nr:transcriptional regulatory protein moc3 [Diplogelasinospora grovesii]